MAIPCSLFPVPYFFFFTSVFNFALLLIKMRDCCLIFMANQELSKCVINKQKYFCNKRYKMLSQKLYLDNIEAEVKQ